MNKKIMSLLLALALVVSCFSAVGTLKKADAADGVASFATVKSITDFRNYIDNDNPYSFQETIVYKDGSTTGVYNVTIPSAGQLLVVCLTEDGYVRGKIYSNYSLTSEIGNADDHTSSRDTITPFDVQAGTYYIRGERWNGHDDMKVTVYIGFIPADSTGVTYSDTSTKYDKTNNVSFAAIKAKSELASYINANNPAVSEETVGTGEKGIGATHSFTVEEGGWLFAYPLSEETYLRFRIYSDKHMSSRVFSDNTMEGTTKDPYSVYLTPGTYYYRGERWNGHDDLKLTVYMGFMKDSDRLKATVKNNGTSSATVSFTGESGLIRVVKGEYDAVNIKSDEFWSTNDRANALEGTSKELTENGDYVARLETADGFYAMVPFNVSGLKEGTTTTTTKKKNYKIKLKKKKITVKVKKTAKIKYSVTGGYKGKVKFSSNKKKIATVNQKGVVKGKKKGTCKVTLKLNNGKKAVVTVKVKK